MPGCPPKWSGSSSNSLSNRSGPRSPAASRSWGAVVRVARSGDAPSPTSPPSSCQRSHRDCKRTQSHSPCWPARHLSDSSLRLAAMTRSRGHRLIVIGGAQCPERASAKASTISTIGPAAGGSRSVRAVGVSSRDLGRCRRGGAVPQLGCLAGAKKGRAPRARSRPLVVDPHRAGHVAQQGPASGQGPQGPVSTPVGNTGTVRSTSAPRRTKGTAADCRGDRGECHRWSTPTGATEARRNAAGDGWRGSP